MPLLYQSQLDGVVVSIRDRHSRKATLAIPALKIIFSKKCSVFFVASGAFFIKDYKKAPAAC